VWKGEKINDGWYTFFAPQAKSANHIVVCIRIESTRGSSNAVHLAGKDVIPLLLKKGYIKSIPPPVLPVDSTAAAEPAPIVSRPERQPVKVDTPDIDTAQ
jgi:hypothetical protein